MTNYDEEYRRVTCDELADDGVEHVDAEPGSLLVGLRLRDGRFAMMGVSLDRAPGKMVFTTIFPLGAF